MKQVVILCKTPILPALLDGVSSKQRVKNGVNGLLKVLYEDSVACHHSLFYHIYIPGATPRYMNVLGVDSYRMNQQLWNSQSC